MEYGEGMTSEVEIRPADNFEEAVSWPGFLSCDGCVAPHTRDIMKRNR